MQRKNATSVLTEFRLGKKARGLPFAAAMLVLSLAISAQTLAQTQAAVEYYYADWDYYFETSFPDEIAILDGGAFGGVWRRTGQTFTVWPQQLAATLATCRFFSTSFAPKSSHFYTPYDAECALRKNDPSFRTLRARVRRVRRFSIASTTTAWGVRRTIDTRRARSSSTK